MLLCVQVVGYSFVFILLIWGVLSSVSGRSSSVGCVCWVCFHHLSKCVPETMWLGILLL